MSERAHRPVSKSIFFFFLFFLSSFPIGAQTIPGTAVVVDANGKVLGQLVAGGIVEDLDTSLFIAIKVNGRGGILRTSSGAIGFSTLVFASNDCTGPAHTAYQGPLVRASWFSVPSFAGGDLYAFNAEDLVFNFTYGSALALGSCQPTAGSFAQAVPITLFQAGWADANFVAPLSIAVTSAPPSTVVSVPAVGNWGLLALGLLLAGSGWLLIRRRHV